MEDTFTGDIVFRKRLRSYKQHIQKEKIVLDVGCGSGRWSVEALKKNNNVLGIDMNADLIKQANQRAVRRRFQADKYNFEVCNIYKFKTDKKYDQIICFEFLEHIIHDDVVLQKLSDALVENGTILISTPSDKHIFEKDPVSDKEDGGHVRIGYSKEAMVKKLERVGINLEYSSSCCGVVTQHIMRFICNTSAKIKNRTLQAGYATALSNTLYPFTWLDRFFDAPEYINFWIGRKTIQA